MTSASQRQCKLHGCTVTFTPPPSAKNKEFCCVSHRLEFHSRERRAAMEAHRRTQAEATSPGESK